MTEEETPVFATGGFAAQQRAQREREDREKRRAASFREWEYLRLAGPAKDSGDVYGESIIIRMVTDEPELIDTKQHTFISTKNPPKDKPSDKGWPAKLGAVCRYTLVPKGFNDDKSPILRPWYNDCYICDEVWLPGKNGRPDYHPVASPRMWGLAVEREEVIGTQEMADAGEIEEYEVGDVVSYRDVEIEHTDGQGNVTKGKRYLVLNYATDNFFDAFLGFANVYKGTIVDRDYKITRKGRDTDTSYVISPLDQVKGELNGKTVKWDLRNPEIRALYEPPFSLAKIVAEQASTEHYNWYFNANVESSWEERYGKRVSGDSTEAASADADPKPDASDDKEKADHAAQLQAMRERLKSSGKVTASV